MYKAVELDMVQEKAARQVLASLDPFSIGRAIAILRRLAMAMMEGRIYVDGDRVFIMKRAHHTEDHGDFDWHMYPVDVYCGEGFSLYDPETIIPRELGEELLCQIPEDDE